LKLGDKISQQLDINFRNNAAANHTAEHLLEHVLNHSIDNSIKQEGAFKCDTYMTFDFKLPRKLTDDEIRKVEEEVNNLIKQEHEIKTELKSHDVIEQENVVGHFTEVYSKIKGDLRVVSIGSFNHEICGGTHVSNTKDLEQFMIIEYSPKGTGT
jgi:alanyl-tRNA synthetase